MELPEKPGRGPTPPADSGIKTVNLALQGGGAHGAFAWGVLDRIIEDGRIEFEGISATSAGAMNAAVLAYGWTQGGRDGAREALASFWRAVSDAGSRYSPYKAMPWAAHLGDFSLEHSPGYFMMDMATRLFSPYQLNPWNFNPLRDVLEAHVDFAALRQHSAIKLFLAATNVETCKVRIFQCGDITADAVLASDEAKQMLIHSIRADDEMVQHGVSSKLNADWGFLTHLRDKGRAHAEGWLAQNFDAIGERSSVDIRAEFL